MQGCEMLSNDDVSDGVLLLLGEAPHSFFLLIKLAFIQSMEIYNVFQILSPLILSSSYYNLLINPFPTLMSFCLGLWPLPVTGDAV